MTANSETDAPDAGKLPELETPDLRWHDLATEPPRGDRPVILFPQISDVGHMYDVSPWNVSNPEFARLNALRQGYTSWFPVPVHADEDVVKARIEEIYRAEGDAEHQWAEGFKRAAENIVEALKQIAPDRPELVNCIRDRFCKPDPSPSGDHP